MTSTYLNPKDHHPQISQISAEEYCDSGDGLEEKNHEKHERNESLEQVKSIFCSFYSVRGLSVALGFKTMKEIFTTGDWQAPTEEKEIVG